jgi:hypothetical protein
MRKFLWLALAASGISFTSGAQDSIVVKKPDTVAVVKKTDWKKVNLGNRANDHFMIQFGYDAWAGKPDTINITGFSRHFNFYLMYDMPFKTAPRMSVAAGLGVGSSSIFFDNTNVDIAGKVNPVRISFLNAENTNHFKKYKISNTWLEVPVELRFVSDPLHSGRSFKVAVGAKVGTMIDAHTKGKNLVNSTGSSLYGTKYIEKEKSKKFFSNAKLAATLRAGYGPFTVFGSYSITKLFKDNQGPDVHLYSVGLCLSGL